MSDIPKFASRELSALFGMKMSCGRFRLDIYDDGSGYDVSGGHRNDIIGPTPLGEGGGELRRIAKWLNEIADWADTDLHKDGATVPEVSPDDKT